MGKSQTLTCEDILLKVVVRHERGGTSGEARAGRHERGGGTLEAEEGNRTAPQRRNERARARAKPQPLALQLYRLNSAEMASEWVSVRYRKITSVGGRRYHNVSGLMSATRIHV